MSARLSPVVSADPIPQLDVPVAKTASVTQPLVLAADRTTVGAYDPSGALGGMAPPLQHWFVLQSDPKAMADSLSASDRSGVIPLITIEPFPAQGGHTPVLEDVAQGATDAELLALARVVADASPQVVLVRWAQEMDLFGQFLADCCLLGPMQRATTEDLYHAYGLWCTQNGIHYQPTKPQFGRWLGERGFAQ